MPEFVRVRLDNGAHKSMPKSKADAAGLKPLKQSAVGRDGRPLPTKLRTRIGGSAVAANSTPSTEADASQSQED